MATPARIAPRIARQKRSDVADEQVGSDLLGSMTLVRVEMVVFSGASAVDRETLATNEMLFDPIRSPARGGSLIDFRLVSVDFFDRNAVVAAAVVIVVVVVVLVVIGIAGGAFPQRRVKGIDVWFISRSQMNACSSWQGRLIQPS